ncbi:hypothetical protein ZIOFF_012683 [Zingiber officinale]|uniref:Uncharacterized protein n=1 Tax=Zingiber officinale TaxID=94328 RepID=A0A8J5HPP9_ZINOF|nr:hypothetical protein ZIOFF_012683 [Zingiber officinale]
MASDSPVDVGGWLRSLPPFSQWSSNRMSFCICSSKPCAPSLRLSVARNPQKLNPYLTFCIYADYHTPISLWTSGAIRLKSSSQTSLTGDEATGLFFDLLVSVLKYGPGRRSSFRLSQVTVREENLREVVLNLAFVTLTFLVTVYEAPSELRRGCLEDLRLQLWSPACRESLKLLVRLLGSNLEEQWMRSVNLGMTNWMSELLRSSNHLPRAPSPLFSYGLSASGLWKVQLYCPVIAMAVEDPSAASTQDDRLLFSLRYQQLEAVIQLAYRAIRKESWIDIAVAVDNIRSVISTVRSFRLERESHTRSDRSVLGRCDVDPLLSETLMAERGYGSEEKHFPSRISLQLTPALQSDVLSVSVSKSSDNPTQEIGLEKSLEGGFDPPNSYLGLRISATESVTLSVKPWKFEQSVDGDSVNLNWFLHDGVNGREVFSSRPSKFALLQPRTWFRNRYSSVHRPFTKQGGIIFAGDEYGERVWWKVRPAALGKTMEWEIRGSIGLTYWPNKQRTFYSETRKLQFKESLSLHLPK